MAFDGIEIPEEDRATFIRVLGVMIDAAHNNSKSKGFWDESRNVGEAIALLHSEASELLEGMRDGNPESKKIPGFTQAEEEAADLVIRLGDMKGFFSGSAWRLGEAIIAKMKYNSTRPHKHARKF
jgi:NTP pyrophosphatase (non-canonical NTP hydrolase)